MEQGHTVVLGFVPGEYTLIEELIAAAAYALPLSNVFGGYHQISSRRATTVR